MYKNKQLKSHYTNLKLRIRYRKQKQIYVDYKGGCCQVCGYNKCLGALEFHHTNPTQKDFVISSKHKIKNINNELDKCILLCSNCHREEHERITDKKHLDLKNIVSIIPKQKFTKATFVCIKCKKLFSSYPIRNPKFCSRSCAKGIIWPSEKEIINMIKTKDIAIKLGCSTKTIQIKKKKLNLTISDI
jgi:5-methylcytosine-specific restriction endonuclease McrA